MSKFLGDFAAGDTIDFKFTTYRPSTGAAFTLAGTPAVSVYKDNSTTQKLESSALTVDFDSVTGLNHVRISTGSDGSFYANGSQFEVVITTGTVDSVSVVGACVGRFTLASQTIKAVSNAVTVGTLNAGVITTSSIADSAITAAKIASGAITSAKFDTGAINATALATDAAEEIANWVWEEPLSDHTSGATYGNRMLRTTNAANYEVQVTNDNHISASVHDMQSNTITSSAIAAGAINANAIGADAIDASALAADAIIEIAQGVLTEATSTTTYAAGDVGNVLARLVNMIEADGADFRYTTNALEQAPSGGGGGGGWALNADQTTGLKRMISAIVGVGGETATPGVLEFDMVGETTTLRITQSTDGNDRLTVEEV